MRRLAFLAVFFTCALSAIADSAVRAVARPYLPRGVQANDDYFFPPTDIGQTSSAPYYICFETVANTCNAGGFIALQKQADPPFNAGNFQHLTSGAQVPTTLPIQLGGNDALLMDVTFTPRSAGVFIGSVLFKVQPNGATASILVIDVSGRGGNGPSVTVLSPPHGILQAENQGGGLDSYILRNIGDQTAHVVLSKNASYFSQSPAEFDIAPGANQRVNLVGIAQPAGAYENGLSQLSGTGVPPGTSVVVRMISAQRPTGPVDPRPLARRTEVRAPIGSNPPGGAIHVKNFGTSAMRALATSDSNWLKPQTGLITIAPGQTGQIQFTVDRSARSGSRTGAATGGLSLHFLTALGQGKSIEPDDLSGTSTVTVPIIDFAAPVVTTESVPALAPGEIALFIPGVRNALNGVSDISLANAVSDFSVTDLKMYYVPSGTSPVNAFSSAIQEILPNLPVSLSNVVQNVFGATGETGSLQLRSRDINAVFAQSVLLDLSLASGSVGTALPVIRSDEGFAAGSTQWITGLQSDATRDSDLYIQEVSGAPVQVRITFHTASGAATGGFIDRTIPAFGLAELLNLAPTDAVAAKIAATSGTGRAAGLALVRDVITGDTWTFRSGSASTTTLIPLVTAGNEATRFSVTNASDSQTNVTLRLNTNGRRRAITRGPAAKTVEPSALSASFTLGANQTRTFDDLASELFGISANTRGYLSVEPTGNVAVAARVRSTTGTGTSVPPAGTGLSLGNLSAIAGLEDAASTTLGSTSGGTTTLLGLLETSGQPATIRVTLHFSFPSGLVEASGEVTADMNVGARQLVLVDDLVRTLMGSQRDSFGDLHNVQFDFTHLAGTGTVVPFTRSIDSVTGDSILRR